MKTKQDIEKQMKGIEWTINSYKRQAKYYAQDGDFEKVADYSQKIVALEAELTLLKWVLDL